MSLGSIALISNEWQANIIASGPRWEKLWPRHDNATITIYDVRPRNRHSIFTARRYMYASAVYTVAMCLFVRPSVSAPHRCSITMPKRIIMQTTPYGSSGNLVFQRERSLRNYSGVTPNWSAKYS